MFGLPILVEAVFFPSLQQGLPNPVPDYEILLLKLSFFCSRWKWLLTPPVIVILFVVAVLTDGTRRIKQGRQPR